MDAEDFIAKWRTSGGNERANTQLFITDLCALLQVPSPRPTKSDTSTNDYVFERHVVKTEIDGTTSNGWIDCYKKDGFILEAKQGSAADIKAVEEGAGESLLDLFGQTASERFKRGMAKRGTSQWTAAMQKAAGQAEGYAKSLPKEHGWPPFLLVSDIGYCIDVYADFSRTGKGYAPFPDRRRFRIELDDLRDEKVRERLKAIWTSPMSLDPSAEAARVTREIANHLAAVARRLEAREQNADRVAHFLMRLLFTMFAEDTGLIPRKSFSALLQKVRDRPENLVPALSDLWEKMDRGGFVGALGDGGETVRQFNGYLFKDAAALPLERKEIDVLIAAAASDWRQVEPAIFGTLLERALNSKERAKLGAHYTPRAYVERLVEPTIMEPLKEDWLGTRTAATEAAEAGDKEKARKLVEDFHGRLARTRVLDPACGTGNFLYVAMARMKELEGEVLELLEELGDRQYLAEITGHTITPENFLGIEINPRAAAIAQLVLWIGYLQWHFKVNGEDRMPEPPVLRDVKTIECRDALIEWSDRIPERDEWGCPKTIWDGVSMKVHPLTGKLVPDERGRIEVYRYVKPRKTHWPPADFVVGNPPFIGNKRMRERLGDGYTDAVRTTYSDTPETVDFVMYWWRASSVLAAKKAIRRFGFITTNSITQPFNRIVIERSEKQRLIYAIPDHPWVDGSDGAAVRIAMTVSGQGKAAGRLDTVISEQPVNEGYGESAVNLRSQFGIINPDLTCGTDVSQAKPLKANRDIAVQGMNPLGLGFRLSADDLRRLGINSHQLPPNLKPYRIGRDLVQRPEEKWVIDFYGFSEKEAESADPLLFQHILTHVKPERDQNRRDTRRENWWLFGENAPTLRRGLKGLDMFIATCRTAKHRIFVRLAADTIPDAKIIGIALEDPLFLGILSSRIHLVWALATGARLEDRPNYNHSDCFGKFPFPQTSDEALKQRVRGAAEKLHALREQVLQRHPDLTLTILYNVLEAMRTAEAEGAVLGEKERDIVERGCVSLIRQYHDEIDTAVAECYGWGDLLTQKDGPVAGSKRGAWIERLDETILERLVALNKERAAEEARGTVRWLRPELQAPGYVTPAEQDKLALPEEETMAPELVEWPRRLPEQVVAVSGIVQRAGRPVGASDVARAFKGKRAATVAPVLDALAGMGRVRKLGDGRYAT